MMEENDAPVSVNNHAVPLYFTPWEIKSLKVTF